MSRPVIAYGACMRFDWVLAWPTNAIAAVLLLACAALLVVAWRQGRKDARLEREAVERQRARDRARTVFEPTAERNARPPWRDGWDRR